jgi:type II secretory pathway pseudopilin PulG
LIEVMFALLILGVGLAGLTRGITVALASNKESEVQTAAALLAAGQIETLRADGYLVEEELEGEAGEGMSGYKWKRVVSKGKIDGLYEVEVIVMNAATDKEIYELRTMLFDPPLTRDEPKKKTKGEQDDKTRRRKGRTE